MGHVARVRDVRNAYKPLTEKLQRKIPLGPWRHRGENNTKMELIRRKSEDGRMD
jgi:hypothetical protein